MGESRQDKAVKQNYNLTGDTFNRIGDTVNDFKNVDLSLGDYRTYDPSKIMQQYGDVFNIGRDNINKTFEKDIARSERNAGERLASQGLSSGSLFNNSIASAGDNARSSRYGAMGDLAMNEASGKVGIMSDINRMDQGDAQFNALAKLRKYNAILDGLNSKLSATGQLNQSASMMDDTNGWDDLLAGLNTVGGLAGTVMGIPGMTDLVGLTGQKNKE